ncbi:MAG: maleylpyruvate isomerase family mycothiol-dependent enzyme [Brevibacterium aurantiacum]
MNPKKNTHPSAELTRDETFAERARVVDLLNGLDSHDWSAPSLCTGWRVREVVAHMTMAYRHRGLRFLLGLARRGFRFNDFADHLAHEDTNTLTNADLLAALRENIRNPWRPPGGGPVGALSHDVIHGLDITDQTRTRTGRGEEPRLLRHGSHRCQTHRRGRRVQHGHRPARSAGERPGDAADGHGAPTIAGPEPSTALTGGETGCGRLETDIVLPFS